LLHEIPATGVFNQKIRFSERFWDTSFCLEKFFNSQDYLFFMAKKKSVKKRHPITNAIVWIIKNIFIAVFWLIKLVILGVFYAIKYLIAFFVWFFEGFRSEKKEQSHKEAKEKFSKFILGKAHYSPLETEKVFKGSFIEFENRIFNQSLIITIVGRRGSGKSALGFRLLENIHAKAKRPCFALGVKQSVLPSWIKSINSIEEAEDSGVILVDEGAVAFGSRKSMTKVNKQLSDLLATARHKDLTLILITQNTGMIDKSVLNLTDIIIVKEGSLLQQKMERNVMKNLYETAMKRFSKIPAGKRNAFFYVFDSLFEAMCKSDLPSFWSEKISKSRKKIKK